MQVTENKIEVPIKEIVQNGLKSGITAPEVNEIPNINKKEEEMVR